MAIKLSSYYDLNNNSLSGVNHLGYKSSAKLLKALAKVARDVCNSDSDTTLFNYFQSALKIDGVALNPAFTLEELLESIDTGVSQELVNVKNVWNIIGGEQGILTVGSLALPLFQTNVNAVLQSQNRHRLVSIGSIAYSILKIAPTIGLVKSKEELLTVKDMLLKQRLHCFTLSYDVPLREVTSDTKRLLEAGTTLYFNGSRAVQGTEKTAVKLSSLGIDTLNPLSVATAILGKAMPIKQGWPYLALHLLWDTESQVHSGYYSRSKASIESLTLDTPMVKAYSQFMPTILHKTLTMLYGSLSATETGLTLLYGYNATLTDKGSAPSFKPADSSKKKLSAGLNCILATRTGKQWADCGLSKQYNIALKDKQAYNILELVFQNYFCLTNNANVAIAVKAAKQGVVNIGTLLEIIALSVDLTKTHYTEPLDDAEPLPLGEDTEPLDDAEPLASNESIDWDAI